MFQLIDSFHRFAAKNLHRTLVEDYVGARGWRVVSLATLYVLGFIFLALGSLVILTFHPQQE